ESAATVAGWLFLAFIPLGIFGCLAALRIFSTASQPDWRPDSRPAAGAGSKRGENLPDVIGKRLDRR
ncbi:hypothetical protein EN787_34125, partial [Mesorhizobium sp. M1C.F.Ca.ET.144.01.1.1]